MVLIYTFKLSME